MATSEAEVSVDPIRQFIAHHTALFVLALLGALAEVVVVVVRGLGW